MRCVAANFVISHEKKIDIKVASARDFPCVNFKAGAASLFHKFLCSEINLHDSGIQNDGESLLFVLLPRYYLDMFPGLLVPVNH